MSNRQSPTADFDRGLLNRFTQQFHLTLKELRETLRDRRTIITLLGMPLLLYPLLGLGFQFIAVGQSSDEPAEYHVALETVEEADWLESVLHVAPKPADAEEKAPIVHILVPDDSNEFDLSEVVSTGDVDLGVRINTDRSNSILTAGSAEVVIIQRSGSSLSRDAASLVERRLLALNLVAVRRLAQEADFRLPIAGRRELVDSKATSAILGLLPLMLMLMTMTGGVYPAIDLTAGERERDTLETLLALPVSRFRLLMAKYVAVVSVTAMTGLMNIVAMIATVFSLQLESTLFGEPGMTLGLALRLFLVLFTFALSCSAVLLMLTSATRSFKEAQAYLIPLLLISIVPGFVILLPGWELTHGTAVLPMVNMLLVARALFEGTITWIPALVATLSTLFYTMAALSIAAITFDRDAIAVGSRGQWRDIFKRPVGSSKIPAPATVLVTLAGLFPGYFVSSGLLARGADKGMLTRLTVSSLLTIMLFVALPIAVLIWRRVGLRSGLQIGGVSVRTLMGAVLLGVGTWPLVFEMVVGMHSLGFRALDETALERVSELLIAWQAVPLPTLLLCLGVIPAVCEELFFRGFLFSGIRGRLGPWGTIGVTAVAFGLFHIVLSGGAAPERFLPSALMGLLLGWVTWKSGSVIPSALLHTIHNSTLLTVAHFRANLSGLSRMADRQDHLPASILAASLLLIVVGILLIHRGCMSRRSEKAKGQVSTAGRRNHAVAVADSATS